MKIQKPQVLDEKDIAALTKMSAVPGYRALFEYFNSARKGLVTDLYQLYHRKGVLLRNAGVTEPVLSGFFRELDKMGIVELQTRNKNLVANWKVDSKTVAFAVVLSLGFAVNDLSQLEGEAGFDIKFPGGGGIKVKLDRNMTRSEFKKHLEEVWRLGSAFLRSDKNSRRSKRSQ